MEGHAEVEQRIEQGKMVDHLSLAGPVECQMHLEVIGPVTLYLLQVPGDSRL